MAKYSADFKLKVVQYAAQNCLGARALSKIYGVNISSLRYWIKHYQCHGEQAFMKPVKVHSKTQAVSSNEELAQLRRENEYLRAENEYLKKLDALLQQKESTRKTSQLPKKKHK